jgi:hypothetical protein
MVKRIVLASAVVAASLGLAAGSASASHHQSSIGGCTINVAVGGSASTLETGQITVNAWGLTAGKRVSMWYSVPNMAGFLDIVTVASDGTIQDVSNTSYSGSWLGQSWTYNAQIWSSSTGDIGKGSPLFSCSTSISL